MLYAALGLVVFAWCTQAYLVVLLRRAWRREREWSAMCTKWQEQAEAQKLVACRWEQVSQRWQAASEKWEGVVKRCERLHNVATSDPEDILPSIY